MTKNFEARLHSTNHLDRVALARDPNCPSHILQIMCYEEMHPEVIEAASENINCKKVWVQHAKARLILDSIEENTSPLIEPTDEITAILSNSNHLVRQSLAININCPQWVLKVFCEDEEVKEVVQAAACHPLADPSWVDHAISRFPELDNKNFWKQRNRRLGIYKRLQDIKDLEKEAGKAIMGDRDQIILNHILSKDTLQKKSLDHANSHLGVFGETKEITFVNPLIDWKETSKYRVAMVMAPSWGVLFPPYNIAKLTGMLRKHDYSVKVYDLNIESFHYLKEEHNEDYWRSERYFLWTIPENFEKYLLPDLEDLFHHAILDIISSKPKVIGFSLYSTNIHASLYMIKQIKSMMPDVCIVVGGPECATGGGASYFTQPGLINYVFVGEAEEKLLNLLENLPDSQEYPDRQEVGSTNSKLDLDTYAYPDYTDYILSNYLHQDGVSIETSRGCVAQCSFCAETYFWKFRSMTPDRVVEEMKYQADLHGVSRFWFVDSLVNGNLKNFQRLVDLIIDQNLQINWNSYARCDGRMSRDFLFKVSKSGCTCLSYGVESGSQKILHDMRKKIEIWEIENNLRDSADAGIFNHANWMIGFPTEGPLDYLHSLQLIFNCRKWIHAISPGFTAGPAEASHMDTDWQVYGIQWKEVVWDNRFLNGWWTTDYKNTVLHRFIRLKLFHIWLELGTLHAESKIVNSQRYDTVNDFYTFKFDNPISTDYITNDHYVCLRRLDDTVFQNSVTNDYFAFLYALWKYYGACEFTFNCEPIIDKEVFGNFLASLYNCVLHFKIDVLGNYSISIEQTFLHDTTEEELKPLYIIERERQDMSFSFDYKDQGNINDWISETDQTEETIHENYRNKNKKIIEIIHEQ